jgi:putative salt-induced outer membrane protein
MIITLIFQNFTIKYRYFMKTKLLVTAVATSLLSFGAMAEDAADTWVVSAELGALITTGNTESSSLFTKISASHQLNKWKNKYTFNTLVKEDEVVNADGNKESQTTADQYSLTGQGDYSLGEHSAAFVFGSYKNTKFSAYKGYTTVAGGYSFRAIDKENLTLDVNAGPGFTESETQDGVVESGAIIRSSLALTWQISESAKFEQNVSVEAAEFNTRTVAESALVSSINNSMQMKFGFALTNDSDVAPGLEKTDTETSATIVVSF